jgi:hypothetical protein
MGQSKQAPAAKPSIKSSIKSSGKDLPDKTQSRRDFVQKLAASTTLMAGGSFYTGLLATTKAAAQNTQQNAANASLKDLVSNVQDRIEPLDQKYLIAAKVGDGDKYGGVMEEYYAKKK